MLAHANIKPCFSGCRTDRGFVYMYDAVDKKTYISSQRKHATAEEKSLPSQWCVLKQFLQIFNPR